MYLATTARNETNSIRYFDVAYRSG